MPGEFIAGAVVGVAAVAVASSRAGSAVRRGLLYGLGKVLCAYDKVSGVAHDVARSAREAAASPNGVAAEGNAVVEAKAATGAAPDDVSSPLSQGP
jgi:hypothetical protein